MADVAVDVAAATGLEVEVFDADALAALGCGGLLGVNAGSDEPPRMVKLTYRPAGRPRPATWRMVGKGVMYDSGGISLKPSDADARGDEDGHVRRRRRAGVDVGAGRAGLPRRPSPAT